MTRLVFAGPHGPLAAAVRRGSFAAIEQRVPSLPL